MRSGIFRYKNVFSSVLPMFANLIEFVANFWRAHSGLYRNIFLRVNIRLCTMFQALQYFYMFVDLESILETTKSESSKRHPGEKPCPVEKTRNPHQRSGVWKEGEKIVQIALFTVRVSRTA